LTSKDPKLLVPVYSLSFSLYQHKLLWKEVRTAKHSWWCGRLDGQKIDDKLLADSSCRTL